ncbi:MAG: hypothetical protein QOC59_292 [Microbacteriaceae bacterium]|jgi:hypothetical protein|nr:hypothetical protein [Microbacteriaceae bacterium]
MIRTPSPFARAVERLRPPSIRRTGPYFRPGSDVGRPFC